MAKAAHTPGEVIHMSSPLITVSIPVSAVYLHKAIMISGKTEATITAIKVPGIKQMGWTSQGAFLIEDKNGMKHLLPSAQVADSILE